jgi:hypothetical protein
VRVCVHATIRQPCYGVADSLANHCWSNGQMNHYWSNGQTNHYCQWSNSQTSHESLSSRFTTGHGVRVVTVPLRSWCFCTHGARGPPSDGGPGGLRVRRRRPRLNLTRGPGTCVLPAASAARASALAALARPVRAAVAAGRHPAVTVTAAGYAIRVLIELGAQAF